MFDANGFEVETCSRCGGSGEYSYCTMYGTKCFRCGGAGRRFTKRGGEANSFYISLFEVPVESIVVGDWVRLTGYSKAKVLEVSTGVQVGSSNGVPYELPTVIIVINTPHGKLHSHHFHGDTIRKLEPESIVAERLVLAMEYQSTLTKLGKVRKSKTVASRG